jgi:phosphate transport system substrate-binding protein
MRIARRLLSTVVVLTTVASSLMVALPAEAGLPPILGAGSTWSQIAIDQWRYDVVSRGLTVNYQGVGSTTGRQFFAARQVTFGVSEIPYESGETTPDFKFRYLPIVAGGTSLMYNLTTPSGERIRDLRLSSATIAGIFTGKITNWSDPAIQKDYGREYLPNQPIKVIVRSDGSGTSAQFSAYLASTQPSVWGAFTNACHVSGGATSFWPYNKPGCLDHNAVGQKGSDGVANYIANTGLGPGAIGYVETGYAIERDFPVVAVRNVSGKYVYASPHNVATALQHSRQDPNTGLSELSGVYRAPEATAYPISSYSYLLAPTDPSVISDDEGNVLGQFISYFACKGQQQAAPLGYSPLPKTLVQFTFDAESRIPGAPNPPAVNGSACPNPTLTGSFYQQRDTAPPNGSCFYPCNYATTGEGEDGSSVGPSVGPSGGDSIGPNSVADGPGSESNLPEDAVLGENGTYTIAASPNVLSDEALAAAKRAADQRILGLTIGPRLPFIVLAALILVLIFGPLLLRMRSSKRERTATAPSLPPKPR